MRLHFSLRALFLLTTVVAGLCLLFIMPSLTANRFLAAIDHEDYKSADEFFLHSDDRFLAEWFDKRWAFRSAGKVMPLTLGQLFRCQRVLNLEITYMQFDQSLKCDALIVATPFGLKKPDISATERLGIIYDGRGFKTPRN